MPDQTYFEAIDRAARTVGVEPEFWDIFGHRHVASAETKRAILESLGIACANEAELQASLAHRESQRWLRTVPACLVVPAAAQNFDVPLCLPHDAAGEGAFDLALDNGEHRHYRFDPTHLDQTGHTHIDGAAWICRRLTVPGPLPLGYHEATLRIGARSATVRIVAAPSRAWQPAHLTNGGKLAGIVISLYGVRSARNWGCGDFTDLHAAADWAAREAGASFLALNPLHAIHNRRPYNTSPYLPNSIFYRNAIYLDLERIPDFQDSARAQRCFQSDATRREIAALRQTESVEYERVSALKTRLLKLAFLTFLRTDYRGDSERGRRFRDYVHAEGDLLLRFATYCALDERIHARHPDVWLWTDWPEAYRDPESPAVRDFQQRSWRLILFHQYAQWLADEQLAEAQAHARRAGMTIGLYHDLALATDKFGQDLWAHRPFFASGCRVGSPPDDFSPQGQDWGFPPPNTARHHDDGYRLFIQSIRKTLRHGGALRLDHVMRFFRLYWIPDSVDATQGAYVRDRFEDLVGILALESVRNRVLVVGEDLGTVEPFIRETLDRFGILSYRVFFFERRGDGCFRLPSEYPLQALVCTATHDLPTLAGFWIGQDIRARRDAGMIDAATADQQFASRTVEKQKVLDVLHQAGLLPAGYPRDAAQLPELTPELHYAVIGFLASTPSVLMAVNQEDLTREVHQQNLPGSTWQYPNWGRKMRFTLEQLTTDHEAAACTQMLRHWLERTGRIPSA